MGNHSCKPNVLISSDDTINAEVVAFGDITTGEEILVSYLRTSDLETFSERREKIRNWGFQCNCQLCVLSKAAREENDDQRLFVRNSLSKVDSFLDDLWRDPTKSPVLVKDDLENLFTITVQSLQVLLTDLQGEADTSVLAAYLKLAELTAFSECERFRKSLGDECNTSGCWMVKAKDHASMMGKMFVSNCKTMEREIRELREE